MARETPQSLRERASNLSLRLQAMETSNGANLSVPEIASSSSTPSALPPPHGTAAVQNAVQNPAKPIILSSLKARMLCDLDRPTDATHALEPISLCEACVGSKHQQRQGRQGRKGRQDGLDANRCVLCLARRLDPGAFTKPFCDFLAENPTVFHTVEYFKGKLDDDGYEELPAHENWAGIVEPGGKYYTTRNGSSLIAFIVPEDYMPGAGIAMIAGHIDAVTVRLRPVSARENTAGYTQLGVFRYAGGLNETWWDRDLSIGGRVIVRDPDTGKTRKRLVKLDWPIARVPTLAPHYGRGIMGSNNPETEAVPIVGLEGDDNNNNNNAPIGPPGAFVNSQPPRLVQLIASELGLADPASIVNWELELYDSQRAQTGGLDHEFIFAGRIDDKLCSWSALHGLLATNVGEGYEKESFIRMVALFDDEEIGSLLRQGAAANFLPLTIDRAVEALCENDGRTTFGPNVRGQTLARSFLVSADVKHAAHPNFSSVNQAQHMTRLNVGVTVCAEANGHVTTDAVSADVVRRVGELGGVAVQNFVMRNDTRSGGTIGPVLSSALGVKAVDVGLPQLSMHSIRATTGAKDPGLGLAFFRSFLQNWEQIEGEWN